VTVTASATAGYILFAAATSGSQSVLADAGLAVDGSTNAITSGVDGGTF
jgi:hypothetical protein